MADRGAEQYPSHNVPPATMAISPAFREQHLASDADCTAAHHHAPASPAENICSSVVAPSIPVSRDGHPSCFEGRHRLSSISSGSLGVDRDPPEAPTGIRVTDPRPSGGDLYSGDGEQGSHYSLSRGVPGDPRGDSCGSRVFTGSYPHGGTGVCNARNAGNPSHTQ